MLRMRGGWKGKGVKLRLLWPSTKDDFGVDRVGFPTFGNQTGSEFQERTTAMQCLWYVILKLLTT